MAGGASVGQQAERYVMISHPLGVFKAWRNLSADVVAKHRNLRVGYRLPWVGPQASVHRTRRKERGLLIVRMSSGRLFLDRVARQHCPSSPALAD